MAMGRGLRSKIKSLVRMPPDFTLGTQPTTQQSFRNFVMLMNVMKNIIPMIVLQKFQSRVLTQHFNSVNEMAPAILSVLPYTLLLFTIFPINASIVKYERDYQNFLSIDLSSGSRVMFNRSLPLEDKKFDYFNNKMDILNKLGYYSGFAIFPLSFTLPVPDSLFLLLIGLTLFTIQGYQTGYWFDLVNRVKVYAIYHSQGQLGLYPETEAEIILDVSEH